MRLTRSLAALGYKMGCLGLSIALAQIFLSRPTRAETKPDKSDAVKLGYDIFNREWMPNDPRSHNGDGLGPVYNDSSCVACHNSGGSGGGGPVSKNIDILNASRLGLVVSGGAPATNTDANPSAVIDPLLEIHAGFKTSRTVVLHKFGTDPNYDTWRSRALSHDEARIPVRTATEFVTQLVASTQFSAVGASRSRNQAEVEPADLTNFTRRVVDLNLATSDQQLVSQASSPADQRIARIRAAVLANNPMLAQASMRAGQFTISRSQRNPTALFGLGLIDEIPGEAIVAMAKREAHSSPQTAGRVSRLKDGKIGRLGWKAQTANTVEFVLNACAVEIGLEVPNHHQAVSPQAPKYRTTGLDLSSGECAALVSYVRSLPRPVTRKPSGAEEAKWHAAGQAHFATVGGADCHAPKLGDVEGLYSDLLLHDMGQEMADDGSYGDDGSDDDGDPLDPSVDPLVARAQPKPMKSQALKGATRQEWRTPPLWGFRDSGPYLHDGRAQTLEQAVALHGGQGATATRKFFELTPRERFQVEAFLKALVAPPTTHLAQRGE